MGQSQTDANAMKHEQKAGGAPIDGDEGPRGMIGHAWDKGG